MKSIKCPNCNSDIDIDKILEDEISKKERILQNSFDEKLKNLEDEKNNLEKIVNERLKVVLANKTKEIREELFKEIESENRDILKNLKDELVKKSQKISELNLENAKLEELKRENENFQSELKRKTQIEINQRVEQERQKIEEQNSLKILEKDEELKILKRQIDELNAKTKLRNNQIIGEAGEIEIENFLRRNFLQDEVVEIKKGQNGGDCILNIKEGDKIVAKIYFESKRTKNFSFLWIDKFKNDIAEKKADVGVIVTETMPNDKKIDLINGIWVCDFIHFKFLVFILRQNLIEISHIKDFSKNKDENIKAIYNYLISSEFKNQIELVIRNLIQLKEGLEKEKRAFVKIWTEREKQIQKAQDSVIKMFSSVKSITNSNQKIEILELI